MDAGGYYKSGSGGSGRGRGRGRGSGERGGGSRGGGGRGGNYQNQPRGRGGFVQISGDPAPPRSQGFRPVQVQGGTYRPTQGGVPAARPTQGGVPESTAGYGRGRAAGRSSWDSPPSVRAWGPPPPPSPSTVAGPSQRPPEPIPDIQRLKISETQPSLESTEKRVPIKRPDVGTLAVRSVRLLTNHFKVNFDPNSTILHYDIDIKLDISSTSRPTKRSISKSDLRSIKDKLFSTHPDKFPLLMTAYDGEKNIFSVVELPTGQFKVELSGGEDSRTRAYLFNIQKVNELKLSKLNSYLRKNLFDLPRDILHGMDLVMKDNPMKYRISCGRSFYDMEPRRNDDLGYGLAAHRGFQQSLKTTSNGLALCLDYSVLAFRKRMPLLDFLYEQGFQGPNDIIRYPGDVMSVIEGLKVTVTHRLTKQKYTISGLTERNTRDISFDLDDPEGNVGSRNVSLVEYFREKYGKEIVYKDIPCLDVGKNNRKNYVPMEFCVLVEGQRYAKEDLERLDKQSALFLKNMSLARPRDRMNSICEMVRRQDGPCGEVTRNFGIGVDMNMTKVAGRVIGPPDLKLGGSSRPVKVDKDKCQWNLVGKQVANGKPLNRWAVIDFSSTDRFKLQQPNNFIQNLRNRCISLGIPMDPPVVLRSASMNEFSNTDRIRRILESVVGEATKKCNGLQLQIIVCVMAGRHIGYKYLKWVSETKVGVLTQCCLSANCNKGQDQYLANLGLKINAKLGGSNAELIDPLPHFAADDHVMFIGADVNHPPAKNITCPSIAAVVGTMNWPAANRYAARVCPQKHREEHIMSFGSMCLDLVKAYARLNGVRPKKIVVFRDGVSDGQNDMVLNEELTALKSALYDDHYRPLITVVVARKRHQTRLFLENEPDGGQSGNVPPGTVVDTTITHPFEFDFYLCSHYGSLGTSKPTHYYVVWDENNFGSDKLQRIIYNLCFTFARCTKPVSLVPPVYYADLVAYRGRLFQEVAMESQSPGSASSSSSLATALSAGSSMDQSFYTLQPDLQNVMFFV